ncbi:MAG: redoxin domain-containing protein [Acidimicrobiia bacterium]
MATRVVGATILIVLIAAVAWTIADTDDKANTSVTTDDTATVDETTTTSESPQDPPENLGPRKDLVALDGWLNTDITTLDELDGQVVMVEMWTFGCSNCKARIPHTQALYATYKDQGFEIVGVHAPEFSYEAEVPNIVEAVERLGVTWPVALDTEKRNFRAWQVGGRRFWPRTYVIDQNGDIRFDHIGEGAYEELEATVGWLLANPPA